MGEKLREYAVLGVSGAGRYAVRHKITGEVYCWRPLDTSQRSREQIQAIQREVGLAAAVRDDGTLRYRDTIVHAPTNTLYIVLEQITWATLEEIIEDCRKNGKYFRESYVWYLLHEITRICKIVNNLELEFLRKSISASSIYIDVSGAIKIDCFDINPDDTGNPVMMNQLGKVLNDLCYLRDTENVKVKEFCYSDDLKDVVNFLTEDINCYMKPDVILYHPTVLANLESTTESKDLSKALVSKDVGVADLSKCDSENALTVCNTKEVSSALPSPAYANVNPRTLRSDMASTNNSLSPTLAALALELPGFVPRRNVASKELACYTEPNQISERTLSQQWMSRLVALREREHNLNCRERDLISKEIMNSPSVKMIMANEEEDVVPNNEGITLPPVITQAVVTEEKKVESSWVTKRQRRSSSVRTRSRRRQQYSYDDLDSSLSACDGSVIVTSTKFDNENMPRRSIFPEIGTKKVHFTAQNPFVESDDSVTLTFYELEKVDQEGYQVPRNREYTTRQMDDDIAKFKYFNLEKATLEKRAAMEQQNTSPSKQPKFAVPAHREKKIFSDITNKGEGIKRTPSKASINSKASNFSNGTKCSDSSMKSALSSDSSKSKMSFQSCASNSSKFGSHLRNADKLQSMQKKPTTRQSMLPGFGSHDEVKKPKVRKSLLPFKATFKFMSKG